MSLTTAQLTTLKADILADPAFALIPNDPDGAFQIAVVYNTIVAPDFWIWRTSVGQLEIVTATSQDATDWSWPIYIARSAAERDCWREMFADGGSVNAALPNVRQGFQDIFSGAGGAAQRTHLLAVTRRKATRVEKLFAVGTGTTISPATSEFLDGFTLSYTDVQTARNLP